MSYYTISNLPEKYFETENIPTAEVSDLPNDERDRHDKLRKGIVEYIRTKVLKAGALEAGCSPSELLRQFRRVATMVGDGEIKGFPGLKRYGRIKAYTLSPENTSTSPVGRFRDLLLREPVIEAGLVAAITSRLGTDGMKLSRKRKGDVYAAFKTLCSSIPSTQYPWGFDSAAKKSVYRYIDDYLCGHTEDFDIWFGHASKGRMAVGRGKTSFRLVRQPFDLVQIDAHRFDVIGTIEIDTEHGPCVIAIRRIWIVLLLDAFTGGALGYSISFEEQISADTVEKAVISSQTPWKPRQLVENLSYEPGSALPAGNVPGLDACPIVTLQMDNFSSHYSKLVQGVVRKSLGCHIAFGAVGAWWTNPNLERFFGVLEQRGIHRVTSSMGSGTTDPMRPKDPIGNAINSAVRWRYILDLAEVLVAGSNARRGSGRSDMTPLEIMRNHIQSPDIAFLPRFPAPVHASAPRLGWEVERKRVAGSLKVGNVRQPYIDVHGRSYTNDILCKRRDLIDSYVSRHIRKADIFVEAFFLDGTPIGELKQNGGEKGHSIRLEELKRARKGRHREDVPESQIISDHRKQLELQAAKDALKRPRNVSDAATELADLQMKDRDRALAASAADAGTDSRQRKSLPKHAEPNVVEPFVAVPRFGRLRSVR
jgi:putative transposase